MPFIDRNTPEAWGYTYSTPTLSGIYRKTDVTGVRYINYRSESSFLFTQEKNYMFVVVVQTGQINPFSPNTPFGATLSFRMMSPFSQKTSNSSEVENLLSKLNGGGRVYHFASPISTMRSKEVLQIGANESLTFQSPSQGLNRKLIKRIDIYELDFYINGYRQTAEKASGNPEYGLPISDQGWIYNPNDQSFWWITSPSGTPPTYSTSGSGLSSTMNHNFIARKIEYDYFNLQFDYATFSGNPTDGIDIYLGVNLADTTTWQNVGSLKGLSVSSVRHLLVGLTGSNTDGSKNYLIISGSQSTNNSKFTAKISNINIYGGYHPLNNDQFLMTNSSNFASPTQLKIIGATAATYSFVTGYASTIANTSSNIGYIKSKIGNGSFRAGIWEAGVWNNGWREDTVSVDFDEVLISIPVDRGVKWRFQIVGPVGATTNFEIGDKISIGNIVGIDINGDRKLFRGHFTILRKNEESLAVEVDTTFPLRKIEKDSQNHKMKVTKNIWLSGAFLNGYFSGVWNSGLFKGLPYSTEMYDTHWIDGKFDGGHFHSSYPYSSFNDTYYIVAVDWNLNSDFEGKLGLTFSNGHPYVEGDWIVIDKNDKSINSNYDGMSRVIHVVDKNLIIVDKKFGSSSILESGFTYRWTSTSLIQRFDFKDNNKSTKTSNQSSISGDVFNFNSWIDVNYDPTRSVTIGKNTRDYDRVTNRSINKNNLFGYPTYDILSSESSFRDSYTLEQRSYKLGTKYKIYDDPISDGSNFTEPFEPSIYTDQVVLKFNILERNSSGATVSFATGRKIKILIVPISFAGYNRADVTVLCDEFEVSNPLTMSNNIVTAINNANKGYTASVSENIVTIRDLNNNSYGIKALEIEAVNYALKSNNSSGNTTVIYPLQNIVEEVTSTQNNTLGQNNTQTTNQNYSPGQAPIRFGRVIEGVGYDNLVNVGWQITQASFSNSDIRRTEISDEDDNIKGEEIQINIVREGITLNNSRIELANDRYSIIEFDVVSYSVANPYYTFQNEYTNFSRRGVQIPEKVDFPIIHLSNLNYDYVNTNGGQTTFTNNQFSSPVLRQYMPITYLPIKENIHHLFTENTYRLDTIENLGPLDYDSKRLKFKKYEYFYSKKDLMMKIQGNGFGGESQSFVVLDNIKMFEVDMIPFFQYFNPENIYKGVQVPFQGRAPQIDYESNDFNFIDNLSIGLDSMNIQQSLTPTTNVSTGILTPPPQVRVNLSSTINLIFDDVPSGTGVPIGSPTSEQIQQPGNESTL